MTLIKTLIWNESTDKWTVGSETFVAGTFEGNATGITTAAITALTEDTSPAETDLIVVYDGSAGSLKKVQKSNFAASATFSVNDEMPLTLADASSDPIEFTNVGTSATDIDLVLADGTSDPINIVGTSNSATSFRDNDNDTKIMVEESADEDIIRMDTAGTERVTIDSSGVLDIVSAKLEIAGAAGSANQVVQTDGSGTISWGSAGITEYDQWQLVNSTSPNTNGDLSGTWSRFNHKGATYIGTGMSVSSGVFTFPSTGKWEVLFSARIANYRF